MFYEMEVALIKKILSNSEFDRELENRYAELMYIREQLTHEIKNSPPGKIRISKSPTRIQYSVRKNPAEKTGQYLGADKRDLVKVYLQKSYDEKVLKQIEQEMKAIEKFITHRGTVTKDIRNTYSDMPEEVKKFIHPIDVSDADYASWWSSIPFEGSGLRVPNSNFETDRGEYVRSKSELMIANMLNKKNIPYRYECRLELRKGVVFYPDFTTLNVAKRKVVYWEHRGMMDDREYARNTVQKLKTYGENGIMLGHNLVITEEALNVPLSTRDIERIIEYYLV